MLSTDDDREELRRRCSRRAGCPTLRARCGMHTGTVWRWNRACYGISDGKPHLRIENRVLARRGPTVIDEVANAAFFFGLMACHVRAVSANIDEVMELRRRKGRIFSRPRGTGSNAQFNWVGGDRLHGSRSDHRTSCCRTRGRGSPSHKIDAGGHRSLPRRSSRSGCVRSRPARSGRSSSLREMDEAAAQGRAHAQRSPRRSYKNQRKGASRCTSGQLAAPVSHAATGFRATARSGQFMSTDLYHGAERRPDPVGSAARMMEWRQIRHLPVEDDHGKLDGPSCPSGTCSSSWPIPTRPSRATTVERHHAQGAAHGASEDTATLEALTLMRDQEHRQPPGGRRRRAAPGAAHRV